MAERRAWFGLHLHPWPQRQHAHSATTQDPTTSHLFPQRVRLQSPREIPPLCLFSVLIRLHTLQFNLHSAFFPMDLIS